ncbi:MAG: peptidylprolyl isomerase [Proteobacteria bacterium]|nr:peptidylprolyl isomerase [Pseudomonadota bacterium]
MHRLINPFRALLIAVAVWAPFSNGASAQQATRIAAVVNDDIISVHDIQARVVLAIVSSSLEDRPEVRRQLTPDVLRTLIDEQLKKQEAKRLALHVTEEDIARAISRIETANRMPSGGINDLLAQNRVEKSVLVGQVTAEIAWAKTINRVVRPTIRVPDDEIYNIIEQIKANRGKPEYRVAEIFLPVDEPGQESEARALAGRLFSEVRAGGDFGSIARSFSRSASAARGGALGWMRPGELDGEMERAAAALSEGAVTEPIRTMTGYYILRLDEKRVSPGLPPSEQALALKQLFIEVAANEPEAAWQAAIARADTWRALAQTCDAMQALIAEQKSSLSGDLGKIKLASLPPTVADAVGGLQVGAATRPLRVAGGVAVLMVCGRDGQSAEIEARTRIQESLETQRVEISALRYLRDLRRQALVDIRL